MRHASMACPSSDISVKTLRDLHIPYTAIWKGLGCFNHGVYRFQINQPSGVKLVVCHEKRCIFHRTTRPPASPTPAFTATAK